MGGNHCCAARAVAYLSKQAMKRLWSTDCLPPPGGCLYAPLMSDDRSQVPDTGGSAARLGFQGRAGIDMDTLRAVELAEKHGVDVVALREMLRAHPDLRSGDDFRTHKLIDADVEARIVSHPDFSRLPRR